MVMPRYPAWAMAVQWHPEHLAAWQPESKRLFSGFIEAATK
jgi:gamma-glutamyl-gamma-aminobutyrate hydrolase PuuD